jgi:hypothetical protein
VTPLARGLAASLAAAALATALACSSSSSGGGTTPTATANTVTITAGPGPAGANSFINTAFVSVTVCVPGSSTQCRTIPDVMLDTGSTGLRVLASALGSLPLSSVTSAGATIAGCVQYVDLGYNWGPIALADVRMAGEVASSVPIQVIAGPDSTFPAAPSSCANGGTIENTVDSLGANGVLGVASYLYDCDTFCAPGTPFNPGYYYACTGSSCAVTTVALDGQLQNPAARFAADNNGLSITLPALPETGQPSATGTLTFGIGTQDNNALGSAVVQRPDASGNITTVFRGTSYTSSFIDSGSNAIFFLDSATTGLPACTQSSEFYCPATTQSFSASNAGSGGASKTVSFSVANLDALPLANWVFGNVAGPSSTGATQGGLASLYFDWGLPFFFGRTVFVAFEQRSTSAGYGPYWAY